METVVLSPIPCWAHPLYRSLSGARRRPGHEDRGRRDSSATAVRSVCGRSGSDSRQGPPAPSCEARAFASAASPCLQQDSAEGVLRSLLLVRRSVSERSRSVESRRSKRAVSGGQLSSRVALRRGLASPPRSLTAVCLDPRAFHTSEGSESRRCARRASKGRSLRQNSDPSKTLGSISPSSLICRRSFR